MKKVQINRIGVSMVLGALVFVGVGCGKTTQQANTNVNTAMNTANQNTNSQVSVNTDNSGNANTSPAEEVDTSDWQTYSNPTMQFSFQYPPDWELIEDTADPTSHGDIMKDGKIFTSFLITAKPKKQDELPIFLGISHTFLNDDNAGMEEQLKAISCFSINTKECSEKKNVYSTQFTRYTSIDLGDKTVARALLPTGKYILGFSLDATANLEEIPKGKIEIFDHILESITILN